MISPGTLLALLVNVPFAVLVAAFVLWRLDVRMQEICLLEQRELDMMEQIRDSLNRL